MSETEINGGRYEEVRVQIFRFCHIQQKLNDF